MWENVSHVSVSNMTGNAPLSAFSWCSFLDFSLWTWLWHSGCSAFMMVSFICLVRTIGRSWKKLTRLCCPIFCIVWSDLALVQSATTPVCSTSRSPLGSIHGLIISEICDLTCRRNVARAACWLSWWRVSETRPILSIPSRNYATMRAISGPATINLSKADGASVRPFASPWSLTHAMLCSWLSSSNILPKERCYLFTVKLPLHDSCSLDFSCPVDVYSHWSCVVVIV